MKKPVDYKDNFDKKKTQNFIFEFISVFQKNLAELMDTIQIKIPLFSFVNESIINRKISFDSINDYRIYSLFNTFKDYFSSVQFLERINNFNIQDNDTIVYTINPIINRDLKSNNIFDIQKDLFSGVFLKKEAEYDIKKIIKKLYSAIYITLKQLTPVYNLNFELNRKVNFHYYKNEIKNARFFNFELILNDILKTEGMIFWQEKEEDGFSFYINSLINNINFNILNVNLINPEIVNKITNNFKTFIFFEFDITNLITIALEKFSTSELI